MNIREWLFDNKLSIRKMEPILFGTNKKLKNSILCIRCDDLCLVGKTSGNYLGIDIGQTLYCDLLVGKAIGKITNKLKILYRNTRSFDIRTKNIWH